LIINNEAELVQLLGNVLIKNLCYLEESESGWREVEKKGRRELSGLLGVPAA